MEQVIEIKNCRGFATTPKGGVLTFEIQGFSERETIRNREYQTIYSRYITDNMSMRVGDFTVPLWGEGHNLYPQEVYSVTSENKLLPEIINKQVRFLFGKGPHLYQEETEGEGFGRKKVFVPVEHPEVDVWLNSWEDNGFESAWVYLKQRAQDFYFVNTCCSKWHFNAARRFSGTGTHKVRALSYVGADEARLATRKDGLTKRIKNSDCKHVIVGDWLNPNKYEYEVFHRFDTAEPFRYPTAVSFDADKTFSKWVYAFNDWFKGLYEWIKASNNTPRYLNSYLKNALNAHVHVIIPGSWCNKQRDILQQIVNQNRTGVAPVQTEYCGVQLIDDKGEPVEYYETMIDQVIRFKLEEITSMMAGEGKNQGKLWASTRWAQDDGWQFEDFPGKYKEFFSTVIDYDKRADQVTLAGKGVLPAISGVDKDGAISNSGSEIYYSYLVYQSTLALAQEFVLRDLNRAFRYNWPELAKQKISFKFWIDIPAKLQDTTPSERLSNTATAQTQTEITKTQEQS